MPQGECTGSDEADAQQGGWGEPYFRRDVLPRLVGVKLADIMEAARCSRSYASNIRAGKYTPHVSTWKALEALAAR